MKTIAISRSSLVNIMKKLLLLMLVVFWAMSHNAYAAGTSPQPSESNADKRTKANVYFEEGQRLEDAGKYKEASKKYEKSVEADSTYAEAWSNLGHTYRKMGDFKKAVNAYNKAIKINPGLAEAHEYLGEAYAEKGKFDLAEKELKILRKLGSNEADELEAFIAKMKAKQS